MVVSAVVSRVTSVQCTDCTELLKPSLDVANDVSVGSAEISQVPGHCGASMSSEASSKVGSVPIGIGRGRGRPGGEDSGRLRIMEVISQDPDILPAMPSYGDNAPIASSDDDCPLPVEMVISSLMSFGRG